MISVMQVCSIELDEELHTISIFCQFVVLD